jgi:hypothetical protein
VGHTEYCGKPRYKEDWKTVLFIFFQASQEYLRHNNLGGHKTHGLIGEYEPNPCTLAELPGYHHFDRCKPLCYVTFLQMAFIVAEYKMPNGFNKEEYGKIS